MYIYKYTYTYIYIYVYISIYTYTCMYTYMYTHRWKDTYGVFPLPESCAQGSFPSYSLTFTITPNRPI